jgi:hypothetical protein
VTKALPAGADIALENSVELDDALGEERVFAVFCDSAIAVEELRSSLERTGDIQTGSGCTVDRSAFVKERSGGKRSRAPSLSRSRSAP